MITKSELKRIDVAIEDAVDRMKPIIIKLSKKGIKANCYTLAAYHDLVTAHNKINKAIEA